MSTAQYRNLKSLRRSSTAEVFLAVRQADGERDRLVLVKRLTELVSQDTEYLEIFAEEAQHARALRHPNIVPLLHVDRSASSCGIVMEYVCGESAQTIIDEGESSGLRLPVPLVCRILSDLTAALQHAHTAPSPDESRAGILHRDAGPSNIIVGYDGIARLTDFGTARADVANLYTEPAALKKKLAYTAPEQARHAEVDERSDLFSVGVVGWELLTGSRLFHKPTQAAVLQAIVQIDPAPPSTLNGDVPHLLDEVILTALSKSPSERFSSAAEMRQGLDHVLAVMGDQGSSHALAQWMKKELRARHQQRLADERAFTSNLNPAPATSPQHAARTDAPTPNPAGFATSAADVGDPAASRSPAKRGPLIFAAGTLGVLVLLAAVVAGIMLRKGKEPEGTFTAQTSANQQNAATQATARPSAPAEQMATLVVHIEPGPARLLIDGQQLGEAVGSDGASFQLEGGKLVTLRAEREGFRSYETHVNTPTRGTSHVHINLLPEPSSQPVAVAVAATTAPSQTPDAPAEQPKQAPGAETPRRRSTKGRKQAAHRTPPPTRASQSVEATATHVATLLVVFSPANAQLQLDGRNVPGHSPLRLEKLAPGPHAIAISAAGYVEEQRTISLPAGGSEALTLELRRSLGQLDIVSAPSGADIFVDDKPRGKAPVMGLSVKPGTVHTIEARMAGFASWKTQVTPDAGRNPTVVATLQQIPAGASSSRAGTVAERDLVVPRSTSGDAARGADLFSSRCNACHGHEAKRITTRRYTREQWSRYFATRRHTKEAPFKDHFSRAELADVKAFVMSTAADVSGPTAAGVR